MNSQRPAARAAAALALCAALARAGSAPEAQSLAGALTPAPALPGETVSMVVTDTTGEGFLFGCFPEIHPGSQAAAPIPPFIGCAAVLFAVAPHGSVGMTWDQTIGGGAAVPPGDYWLRFQSFSLDFQEARSDWFCLSVQLPDAPTLRLLEPARVGADAAMEVVLPGATFAPYRVLASLDSAWPLELPGLELCLTHDALFEQTLYPDNGVFVGGSGFLDVNGRTDDVALRVPDDPSLAYQGLVAQAVIELGGNLYPTNAVAITVAP